MVLLLLPLVLLLRRHDDGLGLAPPLLLLLLVLVMCTTAAADGLTIRLLDETLCAWLLLFINERRGEPLPFTLLLLARRAKLRFGVQLMYTLVLE